jgi:hypothetical protein
LRYLRRFGVPAALICAACALAWGFTGTACPLYATFGIPCPACGSTRAVVSLLRGDLHGALHWHPLVLLLPVIAVTVFVPFPGKSARWRTPILFAALALYLALYVWRMVTLFPGTAPMTVNEHALFPRIWQWINGLL